MGTWPSESHYDPDLLREGDSRNVVDKYRYWSMEAIVADLDTHRHSFHVAIENWQHDLNIGSIVRTANAFLADTVHIVGRRRWNRRGAMVTDRYQHVLHHPTIEDLLAYAREHQLTIVAVDNVETSQPIESPRYQTTASFCLVKRAQGFPPRRSRRRIRLSKSPSLGRPDHSMPVPQQPL